MTVRSFRQVPARLVGRDRSRDAFALALLVALGLLVGATCSRLGLVDPFVWFRLARVEAWLRAGGFVSYPMNVTTFDGGSPLYELTLAGIGMATHLSPQQIAVLPIGAIVLPLGCYVLSLRLIGDRPTAFLLSVAMLSNHAFASDYLGTFVYVWSTLLFLAFLVVLWRVISEGKSTARIVALVCLFFATVSLYQTTATWMIFVLAAYTGVVWLRRHRAWPRIGDPGLLALTVALAVYFAYFNRAFNESFLALLGRNGTTTQLTSAIDALLGQLSLLFSPVGTTPVPYEVIVASSPIAPLVVITRYALLGFALLITAGCVVVASVRRGLVPWSHRSTMLAALVTGAAAHTVAYTFYGGFNPRLFGLFGGVIGALALTDAGFRVRFIRAWSIGLASISILGLTAFFSSVPPAPSQSATAAAAVWLLAQEDQPVVSADLGLYGRMVLSAASEGRTIMFANLDSCGFAHLVEAFPTCGPDALGRYVVIDESNRSAPIRGYDWRAFGPPDRYWEQILTNPAQSLVYEQSGIVILRRLTYGP